MTTTAEFIAGFEGYAGRAYWDVNAFRIGYGSDTEGPDQVRVTEEMETTKARALQNLALRIPQFQTEAIYGKTGMTRPTWDKLTEHQKSAITSLVYNYGRLPVIVYPSDPEKTAAAIKALQFANGGVNQKRRLAEAAFYLTPDVAAAPAPAPIAPVPRAPAPQIPVPSAPPSATPAGHPPISATSAGRRAAEQAYIASMVDQLTAERTAIDEEISAFMQMAADLGKLNPAPTTQLSLSPVLPPPATEPVASTTQGTQGMPTILTHILANWMTSGAGTVAGGPAILDIIHGLTGGGVAAVNWNQDIPQLATMLVGWLAPDPKTAK